MHMCRTLLDHWFFFSHTRMSCHHLEEWETSFRQEQTAWTCGPGHHHLAMVVVEMETSSEQRTEEWMLSSKAGEGLEGKKTELGVEKRI